MIEAHGLVKRYGSTVAVSDLSFSVRPGLVTGFLGPNGAGKTTTMRMILGLAAKSLVLGAVTFVVGEVTSFAAFFAGQALISGHAPTVALGDPGVARAVAGAGLYLTALAVLSVAAGTLLRHPAAAIACIMAVLLVLPGIAQALPDSWRNPVTEFWPTLAGSQITSVHHAAHTLQPWPGFGVMCLFVAIVYAIAWTLLDRRDA
jgi:ABC-2 type transport system permease protein